MSRFALSLLLFLTAAPAALAQTPVASNWRQTLRRLERDEPTVEMVRAAVRKHASVDPKRARSAGSRAKTAGWLPTIALQLRRSLARDEDLAPRSLEPIKIDLGDDLVLEARASWNLGRLVFDDAELRALRDEARLISERLDLETTVTRLYYERRRVQMELVLAPSQVPSDMFKRQLTIDELSATLDALSGGYFSREISRRRMRKSHGR